MHPGIALPPLPPVMQGADASGQAVLLLPDAAIEAAVDDERWAWVVLPFLRFCLVCLHGRAASVAPATVDPAASASAFSAPASDVAAFSLHVCHNASTSC